MKYPAPNQPDSPLQLQSRYQNYIGGKFTDPVGGNYFTDTSPVDGSVIGEFPRSDAKDIELALDAAHTAAPAWGKTPVQQRLAILLKIAERIEANPGKARGGRNLG